MGHSFRRLTSVHLCAIITYVSTSSSDASTGSRGSPRSQQGPSLPGGPLPKAILEAWLLLLIGSWGSHGYALSDALKKLGFEALDHTRVYRLLRDLERRGFLLSSWDVQSNGPARRSYRLTESGEEFLAASAQVMQGYLRMMGTFTEMYTGALESMLGLEKDGQEPDITERRGYDD